MGKCIYSLSYCKEKCHSLSFYSQMKFLYVGRLDKEKGIIPLIEYIYQAIASSQDIHIHIFGK
jgi:glycosyltransferase involved in cell wall biosynthesis